MKPKLFIAVTLGLCCYSLCAIAQVNDPGQVAKDATTNHANNDMNNAADNGLNKAENDVKNLFKKKNKTTTTTPQQANTNTVNASTNQQQPSTDIKAYANYDFVPGDKILFEDHFTDDAVGELPAHWILCYGQGQVNDFNGKKVFMLTSGEQGDIATVLEPRMKKKSGYMPAAFTVEFNMYVPRSASADDDIRTHWAGLNFYGDDSPISSYDDWDLTPQQLGFYSGTLFDNQHIKELPDNLSNDNFVNKWHHIAIAYRDKQMKIYVDQIRLYVIPEVLNPNINKFGIRVAGKCVVTDIRIAEGGGMTMVGKKFTDAKIITHGINFDIDKAVIRPESMGTLNMIVQVMKDNPDIKFEVDGHTDNSGAAAHNLTLSQQRADAVKTQLINMGIDASRLTSKGFGDTKPISDNNTFDGKANNRRVEFVKM